ncbi:hypothetical protein EYR36_002602 [Pleurotus pulmonarius]|nr:hypothetical protein EYR36_002602 [Pleurotus pulmonarius]
MVGINKSTRFVGGDLEGNRYYEWANPNNPSRTRRSVKYYKEDDMWLYVGGQKRLAVQWSSWLSHTRAHPPTIEELQADVLRQQKVQHNAALIEAKEQHEREEALRIGGGVPPAISDSDHRAEAHATHDVIDPQHLTSQGCGETEVKWKACDEPCTVLAASRSPGVAALTQDSHTDPGMALGSSDRPQALITHPTDPPQLCHVDPPAVQHEDDHGPMLCNTHPEFWPIAPSYFQRYERSRKIPRTWNDDKIPPLSLMMTDSAPPDWIAYEHPEGALYFRHESKNIFTDASLGTPAVLDNISQFVDSFTDFVESNGIDLDPSTELVLDLEETGEHKGRCGYYLVDHRNRSVFWLDEFEKADLPDWNEVPGVTTNAHIRHELAAQYWFHCELFPHTRIINQELVDELRDMLTHALGARHRFINFHGQPTARLCRNQAVYDESNGRSYLITLLSPMLFSAPEVHLRMLRDIYVDQIVYAAHVNKAIDKLNREWQEFILYATVLLNANVALLAIQSVDEGGSGDIRTPVQISSYLSIAMSIGSIILGLLLVRQNRTKGKESAPEADASVRGFFQFLVFRFDESRHSSAGGSCMKALTERCETATKLPNLVATMTASPFIDAWLTGPGDSLTFPAVLNLSNIEQDLSRNEETNAAYDADPLVGVPGSLRSLEDMITEGGRLLTNNYVHWPEDVSVLFLHGTADQVTSPVAAQQLYDKLPAKRKKMITYPVSH